MSTNSMTYADATGIRTDALRDAIEAGNRRYLELVQRVNRYILSGDQDAADLADEQARKFAHVQIDKGNRWPLEDRLCRLLGIEPTDI